MFSHGKRKWKKMYEISVLKTLNFRQGKINEVMKKKMSLGRASTSQTRLHRPQLKNGNTRRMCPLPELRDGIESVRPKHLKFLIYTANLEMSY